MSSQRCPAGEVCLVGGLDERRAHASAAVAGVVEILSKKTSYVQTGAVGAAPDGEAVIGPLPALATPLIHLFLQRLEQLSETTHGRS